MNKVNKIKLSIVIVHYHEDRELLGLINSIYNSSIKESFEIIVADNDVEVNVKKELNKKFPKVIYRPTGGNIGYGPALNVGEKVAKGEYILLLNPDLKIKKGSISKLISFMEKNPEVGLCGPQLVNPSNGLKQYGTKVINPLSGIFILSFLNKLFPKNHFSKSYEIKGKNIPYEVGVVPGSAMFIRKDLYHKIGRLDNNIFIYFEETDLAKRVKEAGFKVFMVPDASFYHTWEPGKPNTPQSKNRFAKSRFYFFRKNYGILSALVVEAFSRFSKYSLALFLIFFLTLFLRLFRLQNNLEFGSELAMDYLGIRNVILNGAFPLMGPVTSHTWINFGPLYFWLMIPIMLISKFNPVGPAVFMALVSSSLVLLNYFVIKSFFEAKVAILSSFLLAISPLFLLFARWSRFYSLLPFLLYFFILFLGKAITGSKINIFLAGLFLGLMINIHYSALILLPVIFTVFFTVGKRVVFKDASYYLLGLLLANINFLIFSLENKFTMISNLLLWIPYRFASFLGFYKSNNLSSVGVGENFASISGFLSKSFFFNAGVFNLVITLIVGIIFILLLRDFLKKRENIGTAIIINLFFFGILALFILGNAPIHYYSPILPLPILVVSIYFSKYSLGVKKIFLILPLVILFINIPYLFSNKWFYQENNQIRNDLTVPYKLEDKIATYIVTDANSESYKLKRVGPFDYYDKNYAQSYIYLAWLKGNEPKENVQIEYTIYEGTEKLDSKMIQNCKIISDICVIKK